MLQQAVNSTLTRALWRPRVVKPFVTKLQVLVTTLLVEFPSSILFCSFKVHETKCVAAVGVSGTDDDVDVVDDYDISPGRVCTGR